MNLPLPHFRLCRPGSRVPALLTCLMLVACGGGSGSSTPAVTPPIVTPPASITLTPPQPIAISIPSANTVVGSASAEIAAFLAAIKVSDPGFDATITNNAPAVFPLGSTTVQFTATDKSGKSVTASSSVNVVNLNLQLQFLAGHQGGPGTIPAPDGSIRYSSLGPIVRAPDGNFYVADGYAIRRVSAQGNSDPTGVLTGSVQTPGCIDGNSSQARSMGILGLTADPAGNLYAVDACKTIRKISPDGSVRTIAGIANSTGYADGTAASAQFFNPKGIAYAPDGNLYVADSGRVVNQPFFQPAILFPGNTIRKITPAGIVSTVMGQSGSYPDYSGQVLLVPKDISFNTQGQMLVLDAACQLRKVDAGFSAAYLGNLDCKAAPSQALNDGRHFTIDSAGNMFVADQTGIRKVTADGSYSSVYWAPDFLEPPAQLDFASNGNLDSTAPNNLNVYLTTDGSGNVIFTTKSSLNSLNAAGSVSLFSGVGELRGYRDGTGTAAQFSHPGGTAIDSSGNVFVADTSNHVIRKITAAGVVTTFVGTAGKAGSADGQGLNASLNYPSGIMIDQQDNLYVIDGGSNIRKITPSAAVSTFFSLAANCGVANRTLANLAMSRSGSLYAVASLQRYPTKINDNDIYQISDHRCSAVYSGPSSNGAANLAVDSQGRLYIADSGDNTIRRYDPQSKAEPVVYAGISGVAGSSDGLAAKVTFNAPGSLAFDKDDNLYVADYQNHAIRRISPAGFVSTWAGTSSASGMQAGILPATLYQPSGLSVNQFGLVLMSQSSVWIIKAR